MFPDESHKDQLQLLEKVLKRDGFRFVIIGQNHRTVFDQVAEWIKEKFPNQLSLTIEIAGKDYRGFMDSLKSAADKWILIPDFDRLFEKGYEAFCTAINQRRDYFARNNKVLLCFLFEDKLNLIPDKIPDLWSLRTLEIVFIDDYHHFDRNNEWLEMKPQTSLGGTSFSEKLDEINFIQKQIEETEKSNFNLLLRYYAQLGNIYLDLSDFKNARDYFQKALEISSKFEDRTSMIEILNTLGQINAATGNYQIAKTQLRQALAMVQEISNSEFNRAIINNLGQLYSEQANYKKALEYFLKSLENSVKTTDLNGEAIVLNNIGQIQMALGDYKKALEFQNRSLRIRRDLGDKKGESITLNNISQIYDTIGEYQRALEYLEQSLNIKRQIGDKLGESIVLNNMGQIFKVKGNLLKALELTKLSLEIQNELGDKFAISKSLNNLSQIYEYHKAIDLLESSIKLRREINDKKGLIYSLFNLGSTYLDQKLNQPEKAKEYLQECALINKKIQNPEISAALKNLGYEE